ncbi:MAG: hypothetical protein KAU14_04500, partial [Thermoplasmata archaeon]|nr:hypothetical protein [Thermoplasmata archaeon]
EPGTWRIRLAYDQYYWDYKIIITVLDPTTGHEIVYVHKGCTGTWAGERNYYIQVAEAPQIQVMPGEVQPKFTALLYGDNQLWTALIGINASEEDIIRLIENLSASDINATGKIYLLASLLNYNGQVITQNVTDFYITNSTVYPTIELDKKAYKAGETIYINATLHNDDTNSWNVTVRILVGETVIYEETLDIGPGSSHEISITTTAASTTDIACMVIVNGLIGQRDRDNGEDPQNNTVSVHVPVLEPSVDVTITAPGEVGIAPFNLTIHIENTGTVDAELTVRIFGGHQITVPVDEAVAVSEVISITDDTWLIVNISGDVREEIPVFIRMVEADEISLLPSDIYPEGTIEVEFEVENLGDIDSEFEIEFVLLRVDELTEVDRQSLTVFVSSGETYTGCTIWNLTEGDYILNFTSPFGSGSSDILVAKENQADISLNLNLNEGLLSVNVTVVNVGANELVGDLLLTTDFYSEWRSAVIPLWGKAEEEFEINISGIEPGWYNVSAEMVIGGKTISSALDVFVIPSAEFEAEVISGLTTVLGENLTVEITVINVGTIAGNDTLEISVPGIFAEMAPVGLDPMESTTVEFIVPIPADLEGRNYTLHYSIGDFSKEATLTIHGITFIVGAYLDESAYMKGDEALFTVVITNTTNKSVKVNMSGMYLRATFEGREYIEYFSLSDVFSTTFTLPLDYEGEKKVFYGVHLSSGRSLYLSSIYVYVSSESVTIYPDRQVYEPGEVMVIHAESNRTGDLNITGPDGVHIDIPLEGSADIDYTVPDMRAGRYLMRYRFDGIPGMFGFEIEGISAKVEDITLDRKTYALNDTISMDITIESNEEFSGLLNFWLYDPNAENIAFMSEGLLVHEGTNYYDISLILNGTEPGVYVMNYALFSMNETGATTRLDQCVESFDVEGPVILGLGTDHSSYMIGNEVEITAATFGTLNTTMRIFIDSEVLDEVLLSTPADTEFSYTVTAELRGYHEVFMELTGIAYVNRSVTFFVLDHPPVLSNP